MNINLQLSADFEKQLNILTEKYGTDFLYINGIHPSQLDFSEFLSKFVSSKTMADATIDPNANANYSDIRSFVTEKAKPADKLFGLAKIYLEIRKMFTKQTADAWLEQEFSKGFYLNDSASASYYSYCWANDFTKLATEGLFFLKGYNNQPPKHLTTYFDDVIEFISFLSNRQSGAVGMPNVLIWAYYFWKKDVESGYFLKDPDTYLEQNFQKFIYRLNQPFLRIDQCAFTNISIFDHCYLESLFGGVVFPDGTLAIDEIENIMKLQKVFMNVVSEIRESNMFTFPVLTFSIKKYDEYLLKQLSDPKSELNNLKEEIIGEIIGELKAANKTTELIATTLSNDKQLQQRFKDKLMEKKATVEPKDLDFVVRSVYDSTVFEDEDFAKWASTHNMKWSDSNFFVSDNIGVLSNCPLKADTEILYHDDNEHIYKKAKIKDLYNKFQLDNKSIKVPGVEKLVNCKINKFDESADYKITLINNLSITTTANHLNKALDKEYIKTKDLTTEDYLPVSILSEPTGVLTYNWVRIKSIKRTEKTSEAYCLEIIDEDETPEFMLANGIITHNCRLLSDTKKLDAFVNSIGGTALSVGSCRVSTINLVRIAYETGQEDGTFNKEAYLNLLKDRVLLDCKALTAMRHILKRNIEKGLLPNYQPGAVELDKQFCTIGGIGMYEVMDLFGFINTDELGNKSYSDEAVMFTTEILDAMNEVKDNYKCSFSFNIEMIPAENCAGVICSADNKLFNQDKYYIYSNQWCPLTQKCTLQEKCRLGNLFDKKCGGGCIAHIDIESSFPNPKTAWRMLNYVAEQGVIYFAFTTKINIDEDRHAFIGTTVCPRCGKPMVDQFSRVVGFYTPVSSYQNIRKKEWSERKWYDVLTNDTVGYSK